MRQSTGAKRTLNTRNKKKVEKKGKKKKPKVRPRRYKSTRNFENFFEVKNNPSKENYRPFWLDQRKETPCESNVFIVHVIM